MSTQLTEVITSFEVPEQLQDIEKLNEQIDDLNEQLDQATCHANKRDYAIAIFCGTLSGALDALWLKSTKVTAESISISKENLSKLIDEVAKSQGSENKNHTQNIRFLEEKFKVPEDAAWKGLGVKISASNHHLADLAHHPTPVGLLAAIIVQILQVAVFVNKEGTWVLVFNKPSKEDILRKYLPLILSGFLMWLTGLAKENSERLKHAPETLQKLVTLIAATPSLVIILQQIINWLGHLASDADGTSKTAGAGKGIPGFFYSMLYEIASIPPLNLTGFTQVLNKLYEKHHKDLRNELPFVELLAKQAIPVTVNELLTRTCFFITRLADEIKEKGSLSSVNWQNVIPYGNRTVDRMMTVSCLTFSFADVADATIRAAIASRGDLAVLTANFAARINYVGTVRTGIAIAREASYEKRELQLLQERRLLTEERSDQIVEELNKYEEMLISIISKYTCEDIKAYLDGLGDIQQGLIMKDSDLVIRGNVLIQEKFGRQAQFRNQKEFDSLMDSDTSFVF